MNEPRQSQSGKSVIRNVFYGSLTWILPLSLSFIATPIIVRSLGNNDYGIYALVLGFIGYSFTFSFGRAITKYVAEYRNTPSAYKITDVISTSIVLNCVIGLAGVAAIVLLSPWLVREVFRIDPASQDKTILAMYIASAVIFVSMLNQLFSSMLQGIHRFDVYSRIYTASGFISIGGNLALALLGFGLIPLLLWNLMTLVVFGIIFAVVSKHYLPEFKLKLNISRTTIRLVTGYSAGIVGYQIVANVLLLFERGWITNRLGSESLTYYVVPMTLGMYLHGFVSSLVQVIFPLASELNEDREKLLKLYLKATKVITMIVIFIIMSVIVNEKLFLHLWIGDAFVENSSSLLIFHIITFGMLAIMTVSWQMTEGLGFPHYNFAIISVCLIISISLMFLLTGDYGNIGVGISRLAGFGTIFLSIFLVERLFFKRVQVAFWTRIFVCLGIASIAGAVTEYLITSNLPAGWLTLFVSGFSGGAVYILILWLLKFVTEDERVLFRSLLRR
ncbi:MAG: oligosaccharide flippase family protein [Pyrinomonadaceae bacterium]|nr:oligosaccharide flippase family protein [Acidobacteriota bacterium]MBK7935539.1 oligosaccharide flippase family protein [Acidobacteriota bacterium]MBP7376841.1 oligosaccharide flippase family protein [Pyrinomonadaceae bacterium]